MKISARYEVLGLLGQGGMGVVYHVRDTTRQGEKALKTLAPGRSEDIVERFLTEAQVMFRLEHNNIVRVYDFGKDGETYFLTMELIRGKNLRQLLNARQNKGFTLNDVIRMGIETADALNYAHSQKPEAVVHRDIKPVNIMIEEATGRVVVTDFGIAKLMADAGETQATSDLSRTVFAGTVPYSAPEQFQPAGPGRRLDARVDIYALGMVLFEIYTGRHFFAGLSADDVELHHRSLDTGKCPVATPHACDHKVVLPNTPAEFVETIQKAIARDRNDRYRTAADMLADLQKCAAVEAQFAVATARSAAEAAGASDAAPTDFRRAGELEQEAKAAQEHGDVGKARELLKSAADAFGAAAAHAGERRNQRAAQQAKTAMQIVAREAQERDLATLAPDAIQQAAALAAAAEACEAQGQYEQAAAQFRQAEESYRAAMVSARQAAARKAIEDELPSVRSAREAAEQADAATLAADAFAAAVREQLRLEEALAAGELTRVRELLPRVRDGFTSAGAEAARRLKQSVDEARAAAQAAAEEAKKAGAPDVAPGSFEEAVAIADAGDKMAARGQLELAVAQFGRALDAYRAATAAAARAGERQVLEKELPAMRAARTAAEGAGAPSLAADAFAAAAREQVRLEEALEAGELTRVRQLLPKVEEGFAAARSTALLAQASRATAAARTQMAAARDAAVAADAERWVPDALAKARTREADATAAEQKEQWDQAEERYRDAAKAYADVQAAARRRADEERLAAALASARDAMEAARARANAAKASTAAADLYGAATTLAEQAAGAANDAAGMAAGAADYTRAATKFDAATEAAERAQRRDQLAAELAEVQALRDKARAAGADRHSEFSAAVDSMAAAERALAADELSLVGSSASAARERFAAAKAAVERAQAEAEADAALARIATRCAEAREAGAEELAAATWTGAVERQQAALAHRRDGDCAAVLPLAEEAEHGFTTALEEAARTAEQRATAAREAATLAGPADKAIAAADKSFASGEQRRGEGKLVAAAIAFRKAADGYAAAAEARAGDARKAEADAQAAEGEATKADAATLAGDEHRAARARLAAARSAFGAGRFAEADAAFREAAAALRAAAKTAARERSRGVAAAARKEAEAARSRALEAGAESLAAKELDAAGKAFAAGERALGSNDFSAAERELKKAADGYARAREAAERAALERDAAAARKRAESLRATRAPAATGFFARRKLAKAESVLARGTAAAASGDFRAAQTAFSEAAELFEAMPAPPPAPTPAPAAPPRAPMPPPAGARGRAAGGAAAAEATAFVPAESTALLEGATLVEGATAVERAPALEGTTVLEPATMVDAGATVIARAPAPAVPATRGFPVAWIGAASAAVVLVAGVWLMRGRTSAPTVPPAEQPKVAAKSDVVQTKPALPERVEPKATAAPQEVAKVEAPPPPPPLPRIASITPEAQLVEPAADTQSFRIALADPSGATYAWSVDGKMLDGETAPTLTMKTENAAHTVAVTARTAGGEVSHAWDLAALKPREAPPKPPAVAPVISGFEPKEKSLQLGTGKAKRFSVKAKYDGSEPLRYAWSVDGKTAGGNAPTFDFVPEEDDEGGARQVRAEVSAGDGPVARNEWTVTVPLAPVSIARQSPTAAEVVADLGDTTDFSVEARAGRGTGTPLSYTWTVNKRPADANGPRFAYRPERAGTADVEVRVEAPDRPAAVRRWTVKARETAPAAEPTRVAALAPRAEPTAVPRVAGDARRELESWIASYRDAYQQKNVDRLVTLGVVKPENRGKLVDALNDLKDLQVSIASSSIELQGGDTAVVTLTREDSFNAAGRRQTQSINIKKTLRRINGAWVAQ